MKDDTQSQETITVLRTSAGLRIKVLPVSTYAMEAAIENAASIASRPKPPTRRVTVFGGEEDVPFSSVKDLTGLEDDPSYDEWVAAIEAYRAGLTEWVETRTEASMRVMLVQSLYPLDGASDAPLSNEAMAEALTDLGFSAPDNPTALRADFLRYCGLRTRSDWTTASRVAAEQSFISQAEVETVIAGFRP